MVTIPRRNNYNCNLFAISINESIVVWWKLLYAEMQRINGTKKYSISDASNRMKDLINGEI